MRRYTMGILALAFSSTLGSATVHASVTSSPINMALDSYKKAILINTKLIGTIQDARLRREIGQSFSADGHAAIKAGRYQVAKKAFLMAGNFINEPSLFRELGNCYMYLGEFSRSIVLYKKALKANKSDAKTLANLGLAYHHTQRDARAAEAFCHALNLDPRIEKVITDPALRDSVVKALCSTSNSLARKKLHLEAISRLRQALALKESADLRLRLGEIYEAAGQRDDAIEAFKQAVIAKEDLLEKIESAPLRNDLSVALYNDGVDAHKNRAYVKAEKVFQISLRLRRRGKTLYNLGNVAICRGDLTAAIEHYREAIRLDKNMKPAYLNLALVYSDQNMQEKAIDVLKSFIILDPGSAKAYDFLAKAYEAKGESAKAAKAYVAAVNFDKRLAAKLKSPRARTLAASLFHKSAIKLARSNRYDLAVADLSKSVALKGSFNAYFLMGNAFVKLDKLNDAIQAYGQASAIQSSHAELYNNQGNVYLKLRKISKATEAFRKAVRIKPKYIQALNNLGIALRKQGKLKDAIASYKRALGVDPNYAAAHFNLGNAYSELATRKL